MFQGKSYELDYFGCTEQNYVEETSSDGSLKGVGKKQVLQISISKVAMFYTMSASPS